MHVMRLHIADLKSWSASDRRTGGSSKRCPEIQIQFTSPRLLQSLILTQDWLRLLPHHMFSWPLLDPEGGEP